MTSSTRCNPPLQQHSSKSGLKLASLDMYCGTLLAKLGIRRHRCANRAPPTSRCTGTARVGRIVAPLGQALHFAANHLRPASASIMRLLEWCESAAISSRSCRTEYYRGTFHLTASRAHQRDFERLRSLRRRAHSRLHRRPRGP